MFNAIIFDFDGTILHSEPLHFKAQQAVFQPLGIELDFLDYAKKYIGVSDRDTIIGLLDEYQIPHQNVDKLLEKKLQAYQKILCTERIECIADFEKVLIAAKQMTPKLGICTNSMKGEIEAALSHLDKGELQTYFQCITSIEDVKQGKPAPDSYLHTASKLGAKPYQCLVVEDSPSGVAAGKAAGMHVIAITTTHSADELQHAHQIIHGHQELYDLLSR